jgi:hypothetical protein
MTPEREPGSYWADQKIDPANYCPERGEYPHAECEVGLYEMDSSGWSHIHGVCHGHKTLWHLQSGGGADPSWPTLAELAGKGYVRADLE